jgi:mevalonate kinase
MNEREKALRDTFVAEYLVDYSALKAAMRCGFPREFASEWSQRLMDEPYVQQRITAVTYTPVDVKQDEEFNKARIKAQLMKEAHYYGPGSSHSARVAALAALQKMYGMEAAKKLDATVTNKGGVMRAPGIAGLDEWEAQAEQSQDALTRDASS